ncbi:uncharacterized protein NECHADRAFT_78192 [Fusarium vanettenii 77-13-4]|uniref:Uncharacterized protein n=1 Tax=Fusarium vanettenii (strain ATCC MYA-4622 / CBS 123669 / FGSC 9596 / NRRL 45880 / 77-13-4) TaxID=660122 RepID=C7YND6_FUSV7|nr:uncharacterized protein NECHADRAFT_78192 [Fusarium vanettenii 77-13-4]EEU47607.1 predicted protein [Fusarium vanettenii 77-13-4]
MHHGRQAQPRPSPNVQAPKQVANPTSFGPETMPVVPIQILTPHTVWSVSLPGPPARPNRCPARISLFEATRNGSSETCQSGNLGSAMRQGQRVDAVTSSTAQIPPAQSLRGCCELQGGPRESGAGPKKLLTSNHIDGHLDHSFIDYIVPRDAPSETPDHVGLL